MKLLIRNLARTTTEKELHSLFEPFGTVQSCNLVMDKDTGESKGFGFVEMPKQGDAKAAMKSINGKEIAGSKLRVKKAENKQFQIMSEEQPNKVRKQDPLHGITLKTIVTELEEKYGWEELGKLINIKCFTNDPSINSSLKFLRKTPWAREKVEALYLKK